MQTYICYCYSSFSFLVPHAFLHNRKTIFYITYKYILSLSSVTSLFRTIPYLLYIVMSRDIFFTCKTLLISTVCMYMTSGLIFELHIICMIFLNNNNNTVISIALFTDRPGALTTSDVCSTK